MPPSLATRQLPRFLPRSQEKIACFDRGGVVHQQCQKLSYDPFHVARGHDVKEIFSKQRGAVKKLKIGSFPARSVRRSARSTQDRGRESKLLPLPPNRTSGSPAYGSPVGGFTWLRIDELPHHQKEIPADKQRNVLCSFLPNRGRQYV